MSERIKRNYIDRHECVWVDSDNVIHIDAVKMCKAMGVPPTRENQDTVEAAAIKVAARKGIQAGGIDDLL